MKTKVTVLFCKCTLHLPNCTDTHCLLFFCSQKEAFSNDEEDALQRGHEHQAGTPAHCQ